METREGKVILSIATEISGTYNEEYNAGGFNTHTTYWKQEEINYLNRFSVNEQQNKNKEKNNYIK